jgi:integrase
MGAAHAPVPAVCGYLLGVRTGEGSVSVTRLPSGRWRAQVYDPATGKNLSVSKVVGGPGTFATKTEAKRAREKARERLGIVRAGDVTVRSFWERWTTDPLFARPKESSDIRRRELTKSFAERYGDVPIIQVGDEIVADWLAGGGRAGSVQGLCSMFNDAASVKAGRLIDRNPFQKLGISRGKGRRDQQPPTERKVWEIIAHARKLACPSFAAWLQVAAFTGLRPGELDALRWERIDFDRARIVVAEQFSAATRMFDTPKNHMRREAPLTAHARDALSSLAREGEFCFVSLRGEHWTPSSRAYHWKAVRAAAGWEGSLYLATRHFAGWYMVNELEMSSEDVAIALGHQDGGNLVRRLYGHRDKGRALDRIVGAYADAANGHAATPPSTTACRKTRHEQPTLFDLPQTAPETAHDPINRQQ